MLSSRTAQGIGTVLLLGGLGCLGGCGKKAAPGDDEALNPVVQRALRASHLATFLIQPEAKVHVEMGSDRDAIKGELSLAKGMVFVDVRDMKTATGNIKLDLSSLKTTTFGDRARDAAQTELLREALEVGGRDDGETREKLRWAVFTIRSVDTVGTASILELPKSMVAGAKDEMKRAAVIAHGDLLIHDRKTACDVKLELTFHYPRGSAFDEEPQVMDLRTSEPFTVTIADYALKAPGDASAPTDKEKGRVSPGSSLPATAAVSFEMTTARE